MKRRITGILAILAVVSGTAYAAGDIVLTTDHTVLASDNGCRAKITATIDYAYPPSQVTFDVTSSSGTTYHTVTCTNGVAVFYLKSAVDGGFSVGAYGAPTQGHGSFTDEEEVYVQFTNLGVEADVFTSGEASGFDGDGNGREAQVSANGKPLGLNGNNSVSLAGDLRVFISPQVLMGTYNESRTLSCNGVGDMEAQYDITFKPSFGSLMPPGFRYRVGGTITTSAGASAIDDFDTSPGTAVCWAEASCGDNSIYSGLVGGPNIDNDGPFEGHTAWANITGTTASKIISLHAQGEASVSLNPNEGLASGASGDAFPSGIELYHPNHINPEGI